MLKFPYFISWYYQRPSCDLLYRGQIQEKTFSVSILHGLKEDVKILNSGFLACLGDHYQGLPRSSFLRSTLQSKSHPVRTGTTYEHINFLRHAFSFYKRLCFQDEMTESVSPPTPPTLSQILRFWTNSEGMQNQKIILKNPIPLCSKQVVFPKTKEKCGYLKAFVCSKTCKIKLLN